MTEYLLGKRQVGRHEERWPINCVKADDILADNVHAGGPVFAPFRRVVRKSYTRYVRRQRVEPDVHHMVLATRNLHPPIETRPRDRQIAQAAFDKANGFIPPTFRTDKIRLLFIEFEQLLFIF